MLVDWKQQLDRDIEIMKTQSNIHRIRSVRDIRQLLLLNQMLHRLLSLP